MNISSLQTVSLLKLCWHHTCVFYQRSCTYRLNTFNLKFSKTNLRFRVVRINPDHGLTRQKEKSSQLSFAAHPFFRYQLVLHINTSSCVVSLNWSPVLVGLFDLGGMIQKSIMFWSWLWSLRVYITRKTKKRNAGPLKYSFLLYYICR